MILCVLTLLLTFALIFCVFTVIITRLTSTGNRSRFMKMCLLHLFGFELIYMFAFNFFTKCT